MNVYVKVLFVLFSSFIIIKFLLSYTYSLEQHDIEKASNNPPSTDGVTDAEQNDHLLRKIPRHSKEVYGGGMTAKHHQKPLCVSANTTYVRPLECANLDTYCGDWKRKKWHPQGCRYRDFTSAEARQCMGNHTLGFIGDSMIRNFGLSVGLFLSDRVDFGDVDNELSMDKVVEKEGIEWTKVKKVDNLLLAPLESEATKNNWKWQVQIWEMPLRSTLQGGKIEEVLNNGKASKYDGLHPIDLAFWLHGINDYGWFQEYPYGPKFYEQMTGEWLRVRGTVQVPSVWFSMNNNCLEGYKPGGLYMGDWIDEKTKIKGFNMVEDANRFVHNKLRELKLPYFDAAAVLRSPQRCELSYNGLHVKMWVNIERVKMLFNHLCDEELNWVGSADRFV